MATSHIDELRSSIDDFIEGVDPTGDPMTDFIPVAEAVNTLRDMLPPSVVRSLADAAIEAHNGPDPDQGLVKFMELRNTASAYMAAKSDLIRQCMPDVDVNEIMAS